MHFTHLRRHCTFALVPLQLGKPVMFFSESRYADVKSPKQHIGPIFEMIGSQNLGAGRCPVIISNIGPEAP